MRLPSLPPNSRRLLLAVLLLTFALPVAADSAEERGRAIMLEADRRDTGWRDLSVSLEMILRSSTGEQSTRRLRNRLLERENEGDKSLIIFDEPADVRGTALLTHANRARPDDQWLYMPALRRVKRIASSHRAGPFMGSEFAYEDLAPQEVENFTYRFLREDEFDGRAAYVVERYPMERQSGYTRQVVWLDQAHYRIWRIDFYDRRDELQKTLTAHDFELYQERFWRAGRLEMVNHQNGRSTTLSFSDYRFGTGLNPRDFHRDGLQRIR